MNQDQVLGLVRGLLNTVGGLAIAHGLLNDGQLTLIGGVATSLIPLIWSFNTHTDRAKVAAAQAIPAAQVVVSDPALAAPGVKVAPATAETVTVPVPRKT